MPGRPNSRPTPWWEAAAEMTAVLHTALSVTQHALHDGGYL